MSTLLAINARPSRLLSLPFELRKIIFEYALAGSLISLSPSFRTKPHGAAVSLLATCSQINKEATPLFYSSNTFLINSYFVSGDRRFDLPRSLIPTMPKIQNVVVISCVPVDFEAIVRTGVSNLHAFTNLRALRMGVVTTFDSNSETFSAVHAMLVLHSLPEGYGGEAVIINDVQKKAVEGMVRQELESHEVYVEVPNGFLKKIAAAMASMEGSDSREVFQILLQLLKEWIGFSPPG